MTKTKTTTTIKVKPSNNDWDSTFQLMSWWKKETVRKAKVMVVGAGALGNEVLKNLTLLNVGNIFIVDFDQIEYSNLSRSVLFRESDCNRKKCEVAAERLKEINPNLKFQTIVGDISIDVGLGVFRRMDVVIGCLDNRLARLFLNRACHKVNKTWIDGGIQGLAGQTYVFKPQQTCYECTLTANDRKYIANRLSCADIAVEHASNGRVATTPISSSIIGAIQAQEALKVVNDEENFQMLEEYFYYEGRTNTVLQRTYPNLKSNCPSHFTYDPIMESPLKSDMKISEALTLLGKHLGDDNPAIQLDQALILEVTSRKSEIVSSVVIPKPHFKGALLKQYQQVPHEEIVLTKTVLEIDKNFPHQDHTLKDCGIPPLHIIRVLTDTGEFYVELTGDDGYLNFQ